MTRARLPCSLHFPDLSLRTKVSIIQHIFFSRSHEFTNTAMECTATATPQQNGVLERTGRTLSTMVQCMLKDGNFPDDMWVELFFTAVYPADRHTQLWEELPPSPKFTRKRT